MNKEIPIWLTVAAAIMNPKVVGDVVNSVASGVY